MGLYFSVSVSMAFALRDQRAFCKYLCPSGKMLRWTSPTSLARVGTDCDLCNDCGACARGCPMEIDNPRFVRSGLRVHPAECILCQRCAHACPTGALRLTSPSDPARRLTGRPPCRDKLCFNLEDPMRHFLAFCAILFGGVAAPAQTLAPGQRARIDQIARDVLSQPGAPPSASIAVVTGGRVAYAHAYGNARIAPPTPARPGMRYSIGSISKQFTAAALLWAAEQGKLSIDDPISRFLPGLTRASEVSIRRLLSHTSGYQDYWPQDYVFPLMGKPVNAAQILDRWARLPLDFEPGTEYQYSNTGYVAAGAVFEKATGTPLMQFLREKVFVPLGMKSVMDVDQERLTESDAAGYMRYGLGPLRPSPKEGKGWLFAAGELAMTAEDLALWDISLIERRILKPTSYRELETPVRLNNGLPVNYALGLNVRNRDGRRVLSHGGEISGFCAQNVVFPEDRIAVVVLVNQISTGAAEALAQRIVPLLLQPRTEPGGAKRLEQARAIFTSLQKGTIDRSLFTENANSYFSDQALRDFASSLGPLGAFQSFTELEHDKRGGMIGRTFQVRFPGRELAIRTYELPDGKWEQFQLAN
jgi:D-alanyl-D-alanine carboxypeptidase